MTKTTTALALDALLKTLEETLAQGESVQLVGFGTFEVTERAAREGRNPATGEPLRIGAKRGVRFKGDKALAETVLSGANLRDSAGSVPLTTRHEKPLWCGVVRKATQALTDHPADIPIREARGRSRIHARSASAPASAGPRSMTSSPSTRRPD